MFNLKVVLLWLLSKQGAGHKGDSLAHHVLTQGYGTGNVKYSLIILPREILLIPYTLSKCITIPVRDFPLLKVIAPLMKSVTNMLRLSYSSQAQ